MLIIAGEDKDKGRRWMTAHPISMDGDSVVIAVKLSMCRLVSPTCVYRPRARAWAPKGHKEASHGSTTQNGKNSKPPQFH